MKLKMLSALDVAKTVFQLLKIKLCWSNKMLAEITGCMLKIGSNKAKTKKLPRRLAVLMMLFLIKEDVDSKEGRFDNVVVRLLLCSLLRPKGSSNLL